MSEALKHDEEAPFYLDDWLVDPAGCRISRLEEQHKIEPRAMAVLVCLAQQQGQVLSRERLEEVVWPGMVVGYDSLASAIIKLRRALGDDSKQPRYIETVPKKGYRLIAGVSTTPPQNEPAPVSPGAVASEPQASAQPVSQPTLQPTVIQLDLRGLVIIAVSLLALVTILLFNSRFLDDAGPAVEEVAQEGDRLVIAVLPFKNLSDDLQQDYFSDGITADLITDLSKISGLSVIARNSVFTYKDADIDIRTIKSELAADYAIEGSVRKIGNTVRISARLIDASNSINIWADRFDGTLDNIFRFQDRVTSQIIGALEIKLTEKDKIRLAHKYSNSIEAYDEFLHGWQSLWLSTREGMMNARDYFRKAIELDNGFARAYANLAITYIYDYLHGWSDDDSAALKKAHEYADKAISIDPNLPQVYWVKGFADILVHDFQKSLDYAQKAIDLDPSFADGYGLLAMTLNYAGQTRQADIEMRRAMRLNPKYPAIYTVVHGEILFNMHDYDGAISKFEQALQKNPEIEESRIWLAAAYAHAGDIDEASWQLVHMEVNGSDLSLQRLEKVLPFRDPAQKKHLIDGLYKAGLK